MTAEERQHLTAMLDSQALVCAQMQQAILQLNAQLAHVENLIRLMRMRLRGELPSLDPLDAPPEEGHEADDRR